MLNNTEFMFSACCELSSKFNGLEISFIVGILLKKYLIRDTMYCKVVHSGVSIYAKKGIGQFIGIQPLASYH